MLVLWAWLGFNTLIILAGLQTISPEINEAARVDGASGVQAFRRITVPLLRPQIVFVFTLSLLGAFQLYTEPYVLTKGGPLASTEVPSLQIFANLFTFMDYGYAAAMGLAFLAIVVVITLVQYRLTSRGDGVA
jgi:ABC-type sugar transport system permease subunit